MKSSLKVVFLYSQLVWHHITYVTAVTEPERFHSKLGVTHFYLGDFRRAIARLKRSEQLRHSDDRSFARYNSWYLGYSYMNLDEHSEAIRYFEEYLRMKPDDEYIRQLIDWCRGQIGNKEQSPRCA